MKTWRCHYAAWNALTFACHSWQNERPVARVLAFHGFSGCGRDFEILAQHPLNRFDWLAPDWLGHGLSAVSQREEDYHWENSLRYIHRWINRYADANTILLGYSMGARLLLHYACQHPHIPHPLVLISPHPGISTEQERLRRREQDEDLATSILDNGTLTFATEWEKHPMIASQQRISQPYGEQLRERRKKTAEIGLALTLRGSGQGVVVPANLTKLTPQRTVVVVTGSADKKFVQLADNMAKTQPKIKLVTVPDTGHCPHLEAPELFLRELNQLFLQ